jgi:two-component system cell cycle response regulator DivK
VSAIPVLVVDDHPPNVRLLKILLEAEGYAVRTAASGAEALGVLAEFRPRVILMDVQLPDMDGYEVTRRILADGRTRSIPVVAVTSFAGPSDEARAREAGCAAWVSKPVDTRTLPALVGRIARGLPPGRGV